MLRLEFWSWRFWQGSSSYQMNVTLVFHALSALLISADDSIGSIWSIYSGGLWPALANTSEGEITATLFTRGECKGPSIGTMTCYDSLLSNVICLMPLVGTSDERYLYIFILVVLRCSCECMSRHVWGVCLIIAKLSAGPWGIQTSGTAAGSIPSATQLPCPALHAYMC